MRMANDFAEGFESGVQAERERCAAIADRRAAKDRAKYENETDWRLPYAFNRVVRASIDIAAAIRQS